MLAAKQIRDELEYVNKLKEDSTGLSRLLNSLLVALWQIAAELDDIRYQGRTPKR